MDSYSRKEGGVNPVGDDSDYSIVQRKIKVTKTVYPQIYSYKVPDLPQYDGSQKIGYTERRDVHERIREQTNTAAIHLNYELLWNKSAFYTNSGTDFTDKDFHKFLDKSNIQRTPNLGGNEWFYFNGTPERSLELFNSFCDKGMAGLQSSINGKEDYQLRPEQEEAVQKTVNYFNAHYDEDVMDENPSFLWNAKPRFGKTLATYELARRLKADNVLVITNRPAIANSWFDDYEKFVNGYYFVSTAESLAERSTISRDDYIMISGPKKQIAFLSLQDLKGGKLFGGNHDKLAWVAQLNWDLLVIDEAHEGVDTDRTDAALQIIKRKYTLHLSGTPFKALANEKFPQDAIYNWTYLDEQQAKKAELLADEVGPHTNLPDLRMFTYRISPMCADTVNQGIDIDDETYDYSFNLNDFFATTNNGKGQDFVHQADVKAFLHNLTTNEKYPFSTPELRNELKHTFWYVGNRVNSVKAMAKLLNQDPIFSEYKVIIAAGNGQSFEEEANDMGSNEKSFDRVKKAIAENDKTITLSCGQLTTGVTIKEWSAVLMLTDITSPALYMQAAFRAQNPYKWIETVDDQPVIKRKKSAYLFDFSPTRVLKIYDDFANNLKPEAVAGKLTQEQRTENVAELLNFFPVISEDTEGKMVELDASQVFTFQDAIAAKDIVQQRFMSNLLFNDSIKNVFKMPKQIEQIIDKMDIEQNKLAKKSKTPLDLDSSRQLEETRELRINENKGLILGEKIYANTVDYIINDSQQYVNEPAKQIDYIVENTTKAVEPLISKIKEVNHLTVDETNAIKRDAIEKIKQTTEEYVNSDIGNAEALKSSLSDVIENKIVEQNVRQVETARVEDERKTKEEQIKGHLRAFTRTIPMCIMANSDTDITIDNFDHVISDEDFVDLTNITKQEFHTLRDGFDYDVETQDKDGNTITVREHFNGVFDKYRFNAAIAEFVSEKRKLGKYWLGEQHDIFELIPNQKNNQIFTPPKIVKLMIDDLEEYRPDLFERTDSKFIDLYMKSGLYITEIVKRLFRKTRHLYNSEEDCIRNILENQVYGLAPTGILHSITTELIFGNTDGINRDNFKHYDLLDDARNGTAKSAIDNLFHLNNLGDSMFKFDAVVGNPPYQITVSESGPNQHDMPVYHHFYDSATELGTVSSLISPARFLTNAGYTPKSWNEKMLSDPHNRIVMYTAKSSGVFANTDIKGGVVVIMHDSSRNIGPIGLFTPDETLTSIAKKIKYHIDTIDNGKTIKDILYNETKMNLDVVYNDFPHYKSVRPKSHIRDASLGTDAFIAFSEMLVENKDSDHPYEIYGLIKNKRCSRFINPKYLIDTPTSTKFGKWKVLVPKANGSGTIGETISTPVIGTPVMGHTMSFRSIGQFDTQEQAENLLKYIKTKFFRAMVGVLKTTQDMPPRVFAYVAMPTQDMRSNNEINFSTSVTELDQQLYRKYSLTEQEIDFIETRVKPMD